MGSVLEDHVAFLRTRCERRPPMATALFSSPTESDARSTVVVGVIRPWKVGAERTLSVLVLTEGKTVCAYEWARSLEQDQKGQMGSAPIAEPKSRKESKTTTSFDRSNRASHLLPSPNI